jgi:branched-chain amino acid transport system permease protein
MRATSQDRDTARLMGVNPDRVIVLTFILGAALAGVGGVLLGLDTTIDPLTGFRVILSVFAAAVVGGLGSIPGSLLAAVLIGMVRSFGILIIPQFAMAFVFGLMALVLILRPTGLLGRKER